MVGSAALAQVRRCCCSFQGIRLAPMCDLLNKDYVFDIILVDCGHRIASGLISSVPPCKRFLLSTLLRCSTQQRPEKKMLEFRFVVSGDGSTASRGFGALGASSTGFGAFGSAGSAATTTTTSFALPAGASGFPLVASSAASVFGPAAVGTITPAAPSAAPLFGGKQEAEEGGGGGEEAAAPLAPGEKPATGEEDESNAFAGRRQRRSCCAAHEEVPNQTPPEQAVMHL